MLLNSATLSTHSNKSEALLSQQISISLMQRGQIGTRKPQRNLATKYEKNS